MVSQPQEPPQDVRHVRPHHPAIGVQFVHHDELQTAEEIRPKRVMRQDAVVEHVGVSEQAANVFAHGAALSTRGVAVVARDPLPHPEHPREVAQLVQLVVRERFGREEVECRAPSLQRAHGRNLIAQRFA